TVLWRDPLAAALNLEDYAFLLPLLPAALLVSVVLQVYQQWVIRKQRFKVSARAQVVGALTVNSGQLGWAWWLGPSAIALVAVHVGGQLLQTLLITAGLRQGSGPALLGRFRGTHAGLIRERSDFPKYRAPQQLLNSLASNLPILLLATLYGPVSAGLFALARRVLVAPTTLLGKAVSDTLYPRINAAHLDQRPVAPMVLRATLAMSAVVLVPFGAIIVVGPSLFGAVFGAEWVPAGEYARWLSLWLLTAFINRPSVAAIPVLRLQRAYLGFEVISTVLKVSSLLLGFVLIGDDLAAVAIFSVSAAAANLVLITVVVRAARRERAA
ncbi:oligosaccharide flippase family protein, partial [Georgenia sp. 10Sc9-8]|nr:oligosaccharide flippase family protein [Georgenia halotolerans]